MLSRSEFNQYCTTLGVSNNAPLEEIKKAYKKLALQTHPDKNPGKSGEQFVAVNDAYQKLLKFFNAGYQAPQNDIATFVPNQKPTYNFNEIPIYLYPISILLNVDVEILHKCCQGKKIDSNDLSFRLMMLSDYFKNYLNNKAPALSFEDILTLPRQHLLNLATCYSLIKHARMTFSEAKSLTEKERMAMEVIKAKHASNPDCDDLMMAALEKNRTEQHHQNEQPHPSTHDEFPYFRSSSFGFFSRRAAPQNPKTHSEPEPEFARSRGFRFG